MCSGQFCIDLVVKAELWDDEEISILPLTVRRFITAFHVHIISTKYRSTQFDQVSSVISPKILIFITNNHAFTSSEFQLSTNRKSMPSIEKSVTFLQLPDNLKVTTHFYGHDLYISFSKFMTFP